MSVADCKRVISRFKINEFYMTQTKTNQTTKSMGVTERINTQIDY